MPDIEQKDDDKRDYEIMDQEGERQKRIDAMKPKDESCGCDHSDKEDERES